MGRGAGRGAHTVDGRGGLTRGNGITERETKRQANARGAGRCADGSFFSQDHLTGPFDFGTSSTVRYSSRLAMAILPRLR